MIPVYFGALAVDSLGASMIGDLEMQRAASLIGSFTVEAGAPNDAKRIIWGGPLSGGPPLFQLDHCELSGGMSHIGDIILTDPETGKARVYQFWHSNQVGLGTVSFDVQGGPVS